MERRNQARFQIDQDVEITLLGDRPRSLPGKLVNLSGRGLGLRVRDALPLGGAVKIEADDNLYVGEVVYCRPASPGFEVGIALEQALYNLTQLRALNDQLLGVAEPSVDRRKTPTVSRP